MAVTFLEPGGDSTGNVATTTGGGFWSTVSGSPSVDTIITHGTHKYSIKYPINTSGQSMRTTTGILSDSGSRFSFYLYINALPTATKSFVGVYTLGVTNIFIVRVTSGGVLQIADTNLTQVGSNGATLATGQWYRISCAYNFTSTTVNSINLYVNGVSSISITNGTFENTGSSMIIVGMLGTADTTYDMRISDFYVDNSTSLSDMGNIWVAGKRPFSNGTTNGFTTQIGAGGSGYGSGHAPQVNEVPLSTTNGWSMIGAGSAVTEEYTIEGQSVGFVSTAGGTIVDFEGWVDASSATSETAQIIVAGATSNISLTSSSTVFTKIAGSTTYPVGGTDIGIVTGTTLTTVGLYECGIMVAFIPASVSTTNLLSLLGAG